MPKGENPAKLHTQEKRLGIGNARERLRAIPDPTEQPPRPVDNRGAQIKDAQEVIAQLNTEIAKKEDQMYSLTREIEDPTLDAQAKEVKQLALEQMRQKFAQEMANLKHQRDGKERVIQLLSRKGDESIDTHAEKTDVIRMRQKEDQQIGARNLRREVETPPGPGLEEGEEILPEYIGPLEELPAEQTPSTPLPEEAPTELDSHLLTELADEPTLEGPLVQSEEKQPSPPARKVDRHARHIYRSAQAEINADHRLRQAGPARVAEQRTVRRDAYEQRKKTYEAQLRAPARELDRRGQINRAKKTPDRNIPASV